MKNNIFYLLTLLILSCSTPQQSLEQKNYEQAYKSALKELQKGKSIENNKEVLILALTEIIKEGTLEKAGFKKSEILTEKEKAISINQDLQNRIQQAKPFIARRFDATFENLQEEEAMLYEILAKAFFENGDEQFAASLETQDKSLARAAYYDFKKAEQYGSQEEFLGDLLDESYAYAHLIYTIEAGLSFGVSYEWDIERKFQDLERERASFTKVYYDPPSDLEHVDCEIEIMFNSLDFSYDERTDEENYSQKVVTGTKTIIDPDGKEEEIEVFEEVEGTVIIKRIVKTAEWRVRVDVDSRSPNCKLQSGSFREEMNAEITEIRLEGDERAIPNRYRSNNRDELMSDDDMAEELLEIIYERIANHLF